jgi:hypothetical protein
LTIIQSENREQELAEQNQINLDFEKIKNFKVNGVLSILMQINAAKNQDITFAKMLKNREANRIIENKLQLVEVVSKTGVKHHQFIEKRETQAL